MKKEFLTTIAALTLLNPLSSFEESNGHVINFPNVDVKEFVRFVSRIAQVNFIYNESLLDFNVTLVSGKSTTPDSILSALENVLHQHDLVIKEQENYLVIQRMTDEERLSIARRNRVKHQPQNSESSLPSQIANLPLSDTNEGNFHVYKLQYSEGSEILEAIKQYALSSPSAVVANAINGMHWIKSSNSLLFSGDPETLYKLTDLIKSLDKPLKQVFIEVLVLETDLRNSLEFGLEWGASATIKDKVRLAGGNFAPNSGTASLLNTLQNSTGSLPSNVPTGRGFDLSVIGDIIFHKGRSFLSLGSLVSALQSDGETTVVLKQNIITQDNKSSSIFVGDNIPFAGSVVQTIGQSQQTTANIEYRDVGVSLNIKPMLGDENVITLEISEEISQALRTPMNLSNHTVNGIETTKTEMITRAHVPDKHFLVLSGMIRNHRTKRKTGIPFLSKIPFIGAAFSKTISDDEKRNIIIFVRPQIINTMDEYQSISEDQEELCKAIGPRQDVERALKLLKPKESLYGANIR